MDNRYKLIADSFGHDLVKFNEPISAHTALGGGGVAKLFFVATTPTQIIRVVKVAYNLKVPVLVFGTGSKMILGSGFEGVVIKNRTKNISIVGVKGKVSKAGVGVDEALVEVDSGVSIKSLVEFLDNQGLVSSEVISIPGSIGGNLFLNKFLQDKALTIKVLEGGDVAEIKPWDLSLRKHIILSTVFKFKSKI